MNEMLSPGPAPASGGGASPLVRLGGMLGVAAASVGMAIFFAGCAGFDRAFALWFVPTAAAAAGLVSTVLGGMGRRSGVEHTIIPAGVFLNVFGLVGGMLEYALHTGSTIFYTAPAP